MHICESIRLAMRLKEDTVNGPLIVGLRRYSKFSLFRATYSTVMYLMNYVYSGDFPCGVSLVVCHWCFNFQIRSMGNMSKSWHPLIQNLLSG